MKIEITYGRKVPGQQEYSSESLQVTVVNDLGEDALEDGEVRGAIHALYELVKTEVDEKLPVQRQHGPRPQLPANGGRFNGSRSFGNQNGGRKASPKQVNYLLSLANQNAVSFDQLGQFLEEQTGKRDPYELSSSEASKVIDALRA